MDEPPIPGPDTDTDAAQLTALADVVSTVLADALLGACLHGSTGTGRQRPTSDADVLVVTTRPMTHAERRALVDGIRPLSGGRAAAAPARPVELTVVVRDDVRPWRMPPDEDFLYGEWERAAYDRGELPARRPNPDLAILVSMALTADRPLLGPPPSALLDPVPAADLVTASLAGIDGLLAEVEDDTRNVLLTLARILVTVETGRLVAKDEAGEHAILRLPPSLRPVLRRAVDGYLEGTYGPFDGPAGDVAGCADALVAAIRAAASSRMG